jgi:hypothetical protein
MSRATHPADERGMTVAGAPAVSDVSRHEEALARGRAEQNAGDEISAERRFLEVLAATRGSGADVGFIALANLAGLYMRQGRESESLLLARRLVVASASRKPHVRAWARQTLCMAFANIDDWPRLAAELPLFEREVDGCSGPAVAVYVRASLALGAHVALRLGTLEEARVAHEKLVASLDEAAQSNTRLFTELMGAEIEQRDGRLPEAMAAARRARSHAETPIEAMSPVAVEAECLVELEGPGRTRELVREALDAADACAMTAHAPSHLVEAAPKLAELVVGRCDDADLARRAYDMAAAAIVLRAAEIERALVDLPELAALERDDEAALAGFRARFHAGRRRFIAAVSKRRGRPIVGFFESGVVGIVTVCAWCLRVRRGDGAWLPLGHFVHVGDRRHVTHGMCAACANELSASDFG